MQFKALRLYFIQVGGLFTRGFCLEGLYIGILIRVILGSIRTDKETTGLFKLYCSRVPAGSGFGLPCRVTALRNFMFGFGIQSLPYIATNDPDFQGIIGRSHSKKKKKK